MDRHFVAIDADGTACDYLFVIVEAATGVFYQIQCGGRANLQNEQEGFLVQVGNPTALNTLYEWFQEQFGGNCYEPEVWTEELTDQLAREIARIPCFHTDAEGNDTRHFLQLDRERMSECAEAWIPVLSPYGKGILVLTNSD